MALKQQAATHPHQFKILLVEDDATQAQMYKVKLEMDGYIVEVASDGLSALEKARSVGPDIMVLDLQLPKMDGLTVLQRLRQEPRTRKIPVVILSGSNLEQMTERIRELGALDYLIKSQMTPAQFSRRLNEWLRSRR